MSEPPILDGEPLDEADQRLLGLFDELEKNQLTFLDEAGKRLVELTTGLLAVLFALTAFGSDFPPPYLKGNANAQIAATLTLFFYMLAMICGVIALWPRFYKRYLNNLTRLREELTKIVEHKALWFHSGSVLFVLGSLCLAGLIAAVIFSA
jgi:hypothetical protein